MKKTVLTGTLLFLLPSVAFAQSGNLSNIRALINSFGQIVSAFIPILITATVVIFFYGLFQYVRAAGKGAADGKNIMIAGIAALFIEFSLWGIILFAQNAIGVSGNSGAGQVALPPTVPLQNL